MTAISLLTPSLERVPVLFYAFCKSVFLSMILIADYFVFQTTYVSRISRSHIGPDRHAMQIAFTPLIVMYNIEILPFAIRAKGYTVFSFAVTISLIFNQ